MEGEDAIKRELIFMIFGLIFIPEGRHIMEKGSRKYQIWDKSGGTVGFPLPFDGLY